MAKFKVGDKVRILDVSKIFKGYEHWSDGDITEVIGFNCDDINYPILRRTKTAYSRWSNHLTPEELQCIEIITEKPTKKQRIEALEQTVEKQAEQIAELQSTIEKLREALG